MKREVFFLFRQDRPRAYEFSRFPLSPQSMQDYVYGTIGISTTYDEISKVEKLPFPLLRLRCFSAAEYDADPQAAEARREVFQECSRERAIPEDKLIFLLLFRDRVKVEILQTASLDNILALCETYDTCAA